MFVGICNKFINSHEYVSNVYDDYGYSDLPYNGGSMVKQRGCHSGRDPAFQAGYTGSIPVPRSNNLEENI